MERKLTIWKICMFFLLFIGCISNAVNEPKKVVEVISDWHGVVEYRTRPNPDIPLEDGILASRILVYATPFQVCVVDHSEFRWFSNSDSMCFNGDIYFDSVYYHGIDNFTFRERSESSVELESSLGTVVLLRPFAIPKNEEYHLDSVRGILEGRRFLAKTRIPAEPFVEIEFIEPPFFRYGEGQNIFTRPYELFSDSGCVFLYLGGAVDELLYNLEFTDTNFSGLSIGHYPEERKYFKELGRGE